MAAASSAPTTELGTPQRVAPWAAPVLDEAEMERDLRWPRDVKTYASMLNDAQVEGLYRGATLPIRAYHWYLDPNSAPRSVVERVSADYGLPIGRDAVMNRRRTQRRFRFDRHIEDALRAIAYGHYFFEQVGEIGPDGLWHLRKLAPRPPRTITEIKPARDGGLDYIKVPALNASTSGLRTFGGVELPVDRLVAYVWDQEGSNWRGRSMLRSLYEPWKLKRQVMRVGAINIKRAGGVPYVEAPEGATDKQMQELHTLASSFRVGEEAGAAMPHGAQLKFAQAAGGDQAVNYVRLQNEEMSRAWLMMFMNAGQTASGHGSTEQTGAQIDYFALVQDAIAGFIADVFNEHQIEDDVEWNDGPDEPYAPLLRYVQTGSSMGPLADVLDNAQAQGALPADSHVAAAVRGEAQRNGRTRRPARAATQPTVGHRQPTAVEQQAGVDFEAMHADEAAATAALVAAWADVQGAQVDELIAQVAAAGTAAELAAVAPAVAGATIIAEALQAVAQQGVDSATAEAAHQSFDLPAPDADALSAQVAARADGAAAILARALGEAAARHAVALSSGLSGEALGTAVRDHLESLSDAFLSEQLGGAVHDAHNEGRFTAMEGWGDAADFYASELLDTNTCGPCRTEDGTQFDSLAAARGDYVAGGFIACEGGIRCRGTIVAVSAED